jgi:hypothetical protein
MLSKQVVVKLPGDKLSNYGVDSHTRFASPRGEPRTRVGLELCLANPGLIYGPP